MIYFNGKKWEKSLKDLISTKKIKSVALKAKLEDKVNKGEDVYCMLDPKKEENGKLSLIWAPTKEEIREKYLSLEDAV